MKKIAPALLLAFATAGTLTACGSAPKSDHPEIAQTLKDVGLEDIKIGGYDFFYGCGKGYTYTTKFTAKRADGKTIAGVVCSSLFQGNAIRLYTQKP